jgi:hypothetical protein
LIASQATLIDSAEIKELTADKIKAGTITSSVIKLDGVNSIIQSNTYAAGSAGWAIKGDGTAEFAAASIRGGIKAESVFIDADNRWRRNSTDTAVSDEFKVGSNTKYLHFDGTNIIFTGNLSAAGGTFSGEISIGSGNSIFKADLNGIYLGNSTFASAPFSVSPSGVLTAVGANISGNLVITGGSTLQLINDAQDDADAAYSTAISAQGIAITAETKADNAQDDADSAYNLASTKITAGEVVTTINGGSTTISGDKITTGTLNADRISGGTITASIAMNSAAFNGGSININNEFRVLSDGSVFARNMELDYGFSYRSGQFPTNNAVNAQIFTLGSGVQRISQPGSRRELKENIQDISEGLEIVNQLRPRVFTYNEKYYGDIDPTTDEPWTQDAINMRSLVSSYGFIVEEVQEVNPQLVSYRPADTTIPMDQVGGAFDISSWYPTMWKEPEIIAILTKAVQELSVKVAILESKIV